MLETCFEIPDFDKLQLVINIMIVMIDLNIMSESSATIINILYQTAQRNAYTLTCVYTAGSVKVMSGYTTDGRSQLFSSTPQVRDFAYLGYKNFIFLIHLFILFVFVCIVNLISIYSICTSKNNYRIWCVIYSFFL